MLLFLLYYLSRGACTRSIVFAQAGLTLSAKLMILSDIIVNSLKDVIEIPKRDSKDDESGRIVIQVFDIV